MKLSILNIVNKTLPQVHTFTVRNENALLWGVLKYRLIVNNTQYRRVNYIYHVKFPLFYPKEKYK